jgi:hypothetical protein
MPTTIKRKLKSWMLVYVGFVLALTAANSDIGPKSAAQLVSPGTLPGLDSMEQTYFRPAVAELPRNDI